MNILTHIDRLETIASSAGRLPRTRKVLMDLDVLLEIVSLMRSDIPNDIQEAESVLDKREALLNQALLEGRRIKTAAEEESKDLVNENEITKEATQKSEELLSDAKEHADALLQDAQRKAHKAMQEAESFGENRIEEANQYAKQTHKDLEQHLSIVLNSVRRGLDSLDQIEATQVIE